MTVDNVHVPWGPQIRCANSNGEGENVDNGLAFYTTKFSSGVPEHYSGLGLWALYESGMGLTNSEWIKIINYVG